MVVHLLPMTTEGILFKRKKKKYTKQTGITVSLISLLDFSLGFVCCIPTAENTASANVHLTNDLLLF